MKQCELAQADYDEYKLLYDTRLALPSDHPDKWFNMSQYLRYYNELDVAPLVEALTKCFDAFYEHFGVDPGMSLLLKLFILHVAYQMFL